MRVQKVLESLVAFYGKRGTATSGKAHKLKLWDGEGRIQR